MIPLAILAGFAALIYGLWRAYRRWGVCVPSFVAAGVSFLNSAGVISHHSGHEAAGAFSVGVVFLVIGLSQLRAHFTPRRPA
jgi:hypothetical protein